MRDILQVFRPFLLNASKFALKFSDAALQFSDVGTFVRQGHSQVPFG